MKFSSKFDLKAEVYFVRLPFAQSHTCETVKVKSGIIESIAFCEHKQKIHTLYDIQGDGMYYSDINEKLVFETKDEAEMYIFKKYFKGSE